MQDIVRYQPDPGYSRNWTEDDRERAMRLVERLGRGHITAVAALMGRSQGSIQTAVSRMGMRGAHSDAVRDRSKWTPEEVAELRNAAADFALEDGTVLADRVARRLGRSVDVVVEKLVAQGHTVGFSSETYDAVQPRRDTGLRLAEGIRSCMCCRKSFWSVGPGNRLCTPCKRDGDDVGVW